MTTRTRRPASGKADHAADKPAETPAETQAPVEQEPAETQAPDAPAEQAPAEHDHEGGDLPAGMYREETGVSPAIGKDGVAHVSGEGDHFGEPIELGVDKTGKHRGHGHPAAHGNTEANGRPVEGDRSLGNNTPRGDELAAGDGTAVLGVGGTKPADPFAGPEYPSTTLTRESSKAAPVEPDDVKRATEPAQGYVQSSTDPVAAAAALNSMTGQEGIGLIRSDNGKEIKPSELFEVPEDAGKARGFRIAKHRVSELYSVQRVDLPMRRLLFVEGQEVPVAVAEALIAQLG